MPLAPDFVRKTDDERFWAKVRLPTEEGCWPWMGGRTKDGYGSFWTGEWRDPEHQSPLTELAHRWAYRRFVGEVPKGLCVLHTCDNTWCVYPQHFFTGTQADNVADCIQKGRRNQTRVRKLTPEQREEIRDWYRMGRHSQKAIGAMYGVTQATISYITRKP